MNQKQMIDAISERTDECKPAVKSVLSALAEIAQIELRTGGDVTIPGIVKLGTKHRAERMGRNPQTGEALTIPAKTVVTAKPVKALSDQIG